MALARQLTFMAGSMARLPFRQQVEVASAAGFDSITTWPNIWRHAQRKDGLSFADMRSMLDDHGLVLTDVDACSDWAPPSTGEGVGPRMAATRHDFFEACEALGGTTAVAVYSSDAPMVFDRDVAAFAQLCDDAAQHGLRIALEFVAFMQLSDVATAWRIVETAGRANSGLVVDIGHHVRSTHDDAALRAVPPERIFTVQLNDGPAIAPADLADEAMWHRLMPGEGEFDTAQFLRLLAEMGVSASVGPELNVLIDANQSRLPGELAAEMMVATRAMLAAAGV